MKKYLFYLFIFFAFTSVAKAESLLVYGGVSRNVFLGCLNCSRYSATSINNRYGTYGSKYSSISILNRYGTYGAPYSGLSPCNRYSNSAPYVVGYPSGGFYGVLSTNRFHVYQNRTLYNLARNLCSRR